MQNQKKRKLLEVSHTILPKGHSLKVVDGDKNPGRLVTTNEFSTLGSNPLLSKIQKFLPKLKGANEELEIRMNQGEDPKKFNVEYISDDEKEHVEMNIQLVLDKEEEEDGGRNNGSNGDNVHSIRSMGKKGGVHVNASNFKLPNHDVKKTSSISSSLIQEIDLSVGSDDGGEHKPIISIIIPVYNGEKDLNNCFDSIMNQTFDSTKFEVSVYNDASVDNTMDIILKWKKKI